MEGGVLRRNTLRRVSASGERTTYGRTTTRVDIVELLHRLQQRGVALAQSQSNESVLILSIAQGRNTKEAKNLSAERALAILIPGTLSPTLTHSFHRFK